MPKEIRFQQLVKTSGKPVIVSLWTDPRRDRPFMKAVKENRVLTVIQEPASKRKDFGLTGFHPETHAAYLVFPKALPLRARVVGIKYDLVDQPQVRDPVSRTDLKPARARLKPKRASRPETKTFNVIVRRTAVVESSQSISARDKTSARRQALESAKREPFDLSRAVVRTEITSMD